MALQATHAALERARVIVADVELLPALMPKFAAASFIGVDPGDMGTIDVDGETLQQLGNSRLLAILRAQALYHPHLQNGPLLAGASHLAYLPGKPESPTLRYHSPCCCNDNNVLATHALHI